jgi:prepilin-type N-terminal cleavage/methylation domain-containing protein
MKLGFRKGEKGFTLVELMVVMAIMSVLAAIVFPAVTGTTTVSRQTAQPMDINQVQTGTDRFNSDDYDGYPWPTDASLTGVTTPWTAGNLPTGSGPTGSGTSSDVYVFTQNDIAGIDWTSTANVSGQSMFFYPDYVRNRPDYAGETIIVAASSTSDNFTVKKGGEDVYIQLSNTTGGSLTFDKWGLDKDGSVWVFVDAESY